MTDTKNIAVAYYTALGEKNIESVKKYIHTDIQFIDPLEKLVGREAFLKAAKEFSSIVKTLTIQAAFGSETEAMIVYEVDIPLLGKSLIAASLLSFQEGLISKILLIYDTHSLMEKKEAIVST